MFDRLKRALVESFIGAIGLGYLLAQGILHFVNIFAAPVVAWVARKDYREILSQPAFSLGYAVQYATPELIRFLLSFVVWYVLFRWLYFTPFQTSLGQLSKPEQGA